MKLKVRKWGNSLALRIPKALAIEANVASGSTVEMSLSNGELKIKPVEDQEYSLDELLSGITAENIHDEVSTGIPQGKESW
ncbi:MAG: AbrB/MazE/SpoVT family DNA-binding domain-containing protein [Spirochaetaceae bacterium]|nr:MAG: AbrB/MazE/SpoVT family DNA-binding domain-containing protein [Spirochaetaceae bacterium]